MTEEKSPRAGTDRGRPLTRRGFTGFMSAAVALPFLRGCGDHEWSGTDVSGAFPELAFTMTRASDGEKVTEKAYRGRITAVAFGYTHCPDICPMTLANLTRVARKLGDSAEEMSVLFTTVDPNRDTPKVLAEYVANFSPRIDGLRGTDDQLSRFARRCRATYKVTPDGKDGRYVVSHSSTVYVYDRDGAARFLLTDFQTADSDIAGATSDFRTLIEA